MITKKPEELEVGDMVTMYKVDVPITEILPFNAGYIICTRIGRIYTSKTSKYLIRE